MRRANERIVMRTELETIAQEIRQSLDLLRRHL
jgi:hypothetical protein